MNSSLAPPSATRPTDQPPAGRRVAPVRGLIVPRFPSAIPVVEIGRTLGAAHGELDAQLWAMLRELERIERLPGNDS